MKKILSLLAFAAVLFACSPEEINHPSESQIPRAADYEPVINVDQTINQVTFSLPTGTKGVIPVWLFPDKEGKYSQTVAKDGYTRIYTAAGDYQVRMQVMNAAGVSPDYVEKSFHIDNTLVNWDKYLTFFAGAASSSTKEWRIKGEVAGHMGCGEPGTTGTGWWSAAANEKEAFGVYEDRIIFSADYDYTYDPGADGMNFVNKDVNASPYPGGSEDYNYAASRFEGKYSFDLDGEDLYLVLPNGAAFPYIPNNDFLSNPRLKVESANTKTIELVADNGSIAWHFTLSSETPQSGGGSSDKFEGFKYDAASNLWKPADAPSNQTVAQFYAIGSGWETQENPAYTNENGKYTYTLPLATINQWQAQFAITPVAPIALEAAKSYDFSCVIGTSKDHSNITVKLCQDGDDGNILFMESPVKVKGYEDLVFYKSDLKGIDCPNIKLVFDFGGNADATEITIRNIVLKDHSVDDGTVLPGGDGGDTPAPGGAQFVYDDASNLWKPVDAAPSRVYSQYYAPGWSPLANPEVSLSGNKYSFTMPSATFEQWQAQFKIAPADAQAITLSSSKTYDFHVKVMSSTKIAKATVKLGSSTQENEEPNLFTENLALEPYESAELSVFGKTGIDDQVELVFDFGGNPENTAIEISEIVLREHIEGDGGSVDPGTSEGGQLSYKQVTSVEDGKKYDYPSSDGGVLNIGWVLASVRSSSTAAWEGKENNQPGNEAYYQGISFSVTDDVTGAAATWCSVAVRNGDTWWDATISENTSSASRSATVVATFPTEVAGYKLVAGEQTRTIKITQAGKAAVLDYAAATNLWKQVDDAAATKYFYYYAPNFAPLEGCDNVESTTCPYLSVSGSKYTWSLSSATSGRWQCQFFMYPQAGHEVALSAGKKYDLQMTIHSNNAFSAFFKLSEFASAAPPKYEGNVIKELGEFSIPAGQDKLISIIDFDGIDAANINLIFDFGTNPANTTLEISNIVIQEAQ